MAGSPGDQRAEPYETFEALRARLERGMAHGDLAPGADVDALAAYFSTVLEGLSIQARDGTSRETMHAIIDCALVTGPAGRGRSDRVACTEPLDRSTSVLGRAPLTPRAGPHASAISHRQLAIAMRDEG